MYSAKEVLATEEIGRWEAGGQFICYAKDGMVMVNEEFGSRGEREMDSRRRSIRVIQSYYAVLS